MPTLRAQGSSPLKTAIISATLSILLAVAAALPARAQTYSVIHSFAGGSTDGAVPNGDLIQDAAGNMYGTTEYGGTGFCGTVFKLDSSGAVTILWNFNGEDDGGFPQAGLFRDPNGDLYGTTSVGGIYGLGTVFKLGTNNALTMLHSFEGGLDGAHPESKLVSVNGELYGTTRNGGDTKCGDGCGTIFKVTKGGLKTILYRFKDHADGAYPQGLIRDAEGNLYGAANSEGSILNDCFYPGGCGSVFKLDTTGVFTVLYDFRGGGFGAYPWGHLTRDTNGNISGTLQYNGGSDGPWGAVFRLDSSGNETTLHTFFSFGNGAEPYSGILDLGGTIYGTTLYGGDYDCRWGPTGSGSTCGVLYQVGNTGQYTVVHRFAGANTGDGAYPGYPQPDDLTLGTDGSVYGVTSYGGAIGGCNFGDTVPAGCGVIFKYTP